MTTLRRNRKGSATTKEVEVPKMSQRLTFTSIALLGAAFSFGQYRATVLPGPVPAFWSVGTAAGSGVIGGYGTVEGGDYPREQRAILWIKGNPIDVTPPGYSAAAIENGRGSQWVGSVGQSPWNYVPAAFLWTGNSSAGVNLQPSGFNFSEALGVGGGKQVGYIGFGYSCSECGTIIERHATMWSGSAENYVLLHAPDYSGGAYAYDTDGIQTVGEGTPDSGNAVNALLWNTPAAPIVLNPPGFDFAFASGVQDGRQIGFAQGPVTGDQAHALLWNSSPTSYVDLHSALFYQTYGNAMNATRQVGGGYPVDAWTSHALVWSGSAKSVIDLHQFLPPGFRLRHSNAYDIDEFGNIAGVCAEDASGNPRAVIWEPVVGRRRGP
jgi:hypothetical protein